MPFSTRHYIKKCHPHNLWQSNAASDSSVVILVVVEGSPGAGLDDAITQTGSGVSTATWLLATEWDKKKAAQNKNKNSIMQQSVTERRKRGKNKRGKQ